MEQRLLSKSGRDEASIRPLPAESGWNSAGDPRRAGFLWRALVLGLVLVGLTAGGLRAEDPASRAFGGPLTQADVDGYMYLLPRLAEVDRKDPEHGARLLRESGLSRARAAYVGAKITIAQALATGLLSTGQLTDEQVPAHLRPSAEEIALIQANLTSLVRAQEAARRAAARVSKGALEK